VVIAGGGPVGLSLALELGLRNIPCVVVEPRDRTRFVPRAKLANVRTMEHLRRWGLADELRAATPLPADFSTEIAFVTSLRGHEITRFSNVFFTAPGGDARFAEPAQQVPQYVLEPVLKARAARSPCVRFLDGYRVERFREHDDGVDVLVRGVAGESETIRAQYLAGCDGGGSTVRRGLGIAMVGQRGIARNYGVVFRAPRLAGLVPFEPALHFWTVNPKMPAFMGPLDRQELWWLQATAIDPGVDMDRLDASKVVRDAIGVDLELEIVTTDPWEAHALSAERLRDGRVFVAGDAAHLHSPMGAHGMNQGIGDAVDLGWKLAAVLDGWGHPELLDSYERERGPLHVRVIEEATTNYSALSNHFIRPGLDDEGPTGRELRRLLADEIQRVKAREFYPLGLVLGHVYEGSPVVVPDGTPAPPDDAVDYIPRARPGARIPHAWLAAGVSLFDRLGPELTLLRFGPDADAGRLERAIAGRGLPVRVVTIDEPEIRRQFGSRLALVRPDQVLAWHADAEPRDPETVLDVITGRSTRTADLAFSGGH
jgi:2-polyprenyl-6-methoxyphenol hydroxylase-like FAD-dependent oxidoreductase